MKFLADMGISMTTVGALRNLDHDVVHLREQGLIRMEDPDIVGKATNEGRIVLTFDLDFGAIGAGSHPAPVFGFWPLGPYRLASRLHAEPVLVWPAGAPRP